MGSGCPDKPLAAQFNPRDALARTGPSNLDRVLPYPRAIVAQDWPLIRFLAAALLCAATPIVWTDGGYNGWQLDPPLAKVPLLNRDRQAERRHEWLRRPAAPLDGRAHLLLVLDFLGNLLEILCAFQVGGEDHDLAAGRGDEVGFNFIVARCLQEPCPMGVEATEPCQGEGYLVPAIRVSRHLPDNLTLLLQRGNAIGEWSRSAEFARPDLALQLSRRPGARDRRRSLLRGKQDEKSPSIGMRKCRRMRDEGRA